METETETETQTQTVTEIQEIEGFDEEDQDGAQKAVEVCSV